jgi:hypothetical protein
VAGAAGGAPFWDLEELLAERGIDLDHVTVYAGSIGSLPSWSTPPAELRRELFDPAPLDHHDLTNEAVTPAA